MEPCQKESNPVQVQLQLDLFIEDIDNLYDWSRSGVETMRVALLVNSIRDVCDRRVSASSKSEVWEWINRDDEGVFSFKTCLAEYDERIDPTSMREYIKYLSNHILSNPSIKKEIELDL